MRESLKLTLKEEENILVSMGISASPRHRWIETKQESQYTIDSGHINRLRIRISNDFTHNMINICKLIYLEELDLNTNSITELSEQIGQLKKLKKLSVNHTRIVELPAAIGNLSLLEKLDVSDVPLKRLPKEIGELTQLRELNLANSQINTIPSEIGGLVELTELDLHQTPIESLPEEIKFLKKIYRIDLNKSSIKFLPTGFGELRTLQILLLSDTHIDVLSPPLIQLLKNRELDVFYWGTHHQNCIERDNHRNIKKIKLWSQYPINRKNLKDKQNENEKLGFLNEPGEITAISSAIEQLTTLIYLDFGGSNIRTLPPEIGQLINLETMCMENTLLSALPPEIGQLRNLKSLRLEKTLLNTLPHEIGRLTNLDNLNLKSTPLKELPSEIGQLSHLTELNLDNTKLTELPSEIGNLSVIEEISLESCLLTTLPASIAQLTTLKYLLLENSISYYSELENDQKYDDYLESTTIKYLPLELGQCNNLISFSVGKSLLNEYQKVTEIPDNEKNPLGYVLRKIDKDFVKIISEKINSNTSLGILVYYKDKFQQYAGILDVTCDLNQTDTASIVKKLIMKN